MSLVVHLTVEELRGIVSETVRIELAKLEASREVMKPEEAADFLRLHPKTLLRYVKEHDIPMRMMGTEKRFLRSELLLHLKGRAA